MNAITIDRAHDKDAAIVNGLSVDVEDWFQVGAFETVIERDEWASLDDRVDRNVREILDLFDETGAKATFFTLGWVAQRHGPLLREIVARGHELASHGWDHQRVFRMDRASFGADVERAQRTIEDAGGVRVIGYRAPSFSIDTRTPWAHAELAAAGYRYSSSIAPIAHDHYGWPDAPRYAHRPLADSPLLEVPVTVATVGPKQVTAGGGFFRLLPSAVTDRAVRRANAEQQPAMFYFHPWEVDPDQPRVTGAPLRSRLRHYSRLSAMHGKLARLLARHEWGRVDQAIAA